MSIRPGPDDGRRADGASLCTSGAASVACPDRARAALLFDATFAALRPDVALRVEDERDQGFLEEMSAACSPLNGMLPDAMLLQQAELQRVGHARSFPSAMRRIAWRDDRPVGRMLVDWGSAWTRCVDLAVLPALQGEGIGTALLTAWLAVADRLALTATLSVRRGNRAASLYRRLGFVENGAAADPLMAPVMAMSRPR